MGGYRRNAWVVITEIRMLRWNDTNDEYYRVDADLFINDIAEDDYFEVL